MIFGLSYKLITKYLKILLLGILLILMKFLNSFALNKRIWNLNFKSLIMENGISILIFTLSLNRLPKKY